MLLVYSAECFPNQITVVDLTCFITLNFFKVFKEKLYHVDLSTLKVHLYTLVSLPELAPKTSRTWLPFLSF